MRFFVIIFLCATALRVLFSLIIIILCFNYFNNEKHFFNPQELVFYPADFEPRCKLTNLHSDAQKIILGFFVSLFSGHIKTHTILFTFSPSNPTCMFLRHRPLFHSSFFNYFPRLMPKCNVSSRLFLPPANFWCRLFSIRKSAINAIAPQTHATDPFHRFECGHACVCEFCASRIRSINPPTISCSLQNIIVCLFYIFYSPPYLLSPVCAKLHFICTW